jgi:hypothetical protein
MTHIKLLTDGKISITVKSVAEAKIALKELKIKKKELQVQKKEISERLRCIRSSYTDTNLRRGSKMRGGGWLGKVVRTWQTAERDNARQSLANNIAPYEEKKRWIESALISVDKGILIIENFILQHS